MIDTITPANEAEFAAIRDRWIQHGLCTDRADRDAGNRAVAKAYECAGLKPPERIIWYNNPIHAAMAYRTFELADGEEPRDWFRYIGGGAWASWPAWVEAHASLGVTGLEVAEGRVEVAKHCFWWWALDTVAFMVDRPTNIVGEQVAAAGWGSHRLHNDKGPALSWTEGPNLYVWHGSQVPEWVVETPTMDKIAKEPNSEIRRAAIESLGWHNYTAKMTLVDDSGDEQIGRLYEPPADLYEDLDESLRVLVVRNGTDSVDGSPLWYGQTVPASVTTAQSAQDWMAGVSGDLVLARRT